MNIVIIGCGKVGYTIAKQLDEEGYDITVVETNPDALNRAVRHLDVVGVQGSGTDISVLKEAGAPKANLVIAVTPSDETNIVCCLLSKKLGAQRTISRVRNPEYAQSKYLFKDDIGLSMLINPEEAAASEIVRMLPYSPKVHISSFGKGQMEIAEIIVEENNPLSNRSISWIDSHSKSQVQYCIIQRDNQIIIPDGHTIVQAGDKLTFTGESKAIHRFFQEFYKEKRARMHEIMIVGGSRIAMYLTKMLLNMNIAVKLIEKSEKKARDLAVLFPNITVICADGTDQNVLLSENICEMDGFVSLTDNDEENVILSMFAAKQGVNRVVPKVNRVELNFLLEQLGLINAVTPKNIAADQITQYVRAIQNSIGSSVEAMIHAANDHVEFLEFRVRANCQFIDVPLKNLNLKPDILIAYISHNGIPVIARGESRVEVGDSIIVVSKLKGLRDINDILTSSNAPKAELAGNS